MTFLSVMEVHEMALSCLNNEALYGHAETSQLIAAWSDSIYPSNLCGLSSEFRSVVAPSRWW